jgi:hypothetical protein
MLRYIHIHVCSRSWVLRRARVGKPDDRSKLPSLVDYIIIVIWVYAPRRGQWRPNRTLQETTLSLASKYLNHWHLSTANQVVSGVINRANLTP